MSDTTKGQVARKAIRETIEANLSKYSPNTEKKMANLIAYDFNLSPDTVRYCYLPMFIDKGILVLTDKNGIYSVAEPESFMGIHKTRKGRTESENEMTEPDDVKEMLARFEHEMNVSDAKDSNTVIKKFEYWTNRKATLKQQLLLGKYAKQKGIGIARPRPIGISARRGVPREQLKRHYTAHKVRGKTRMVARIPKGQNGAGRFATKR